MTTGFRTPPASVLSSNGQPHHPPPSAAGERLPRVRRPRRPGLAAAGALLVLLCGLTSAALVRSGNDRVRVLALARDVQAGQVLTAQDLRVAELAGSGLSAVGAAGATGVVGQTVTVSLPAGTLLNTRMLTATPLPAAGWQLVAVAVKPGGIPEQAAPGRDVSIIRVTAPGDTGTTGPQVLVGRARVVSVRDDPTGAAVLVSLQVPQAAAVAVAQAAASGAVALTLLPVTP